jgi:hypothetical protein
MTPGKESSRVSTKRNKGTMPTLTTQSIGAVGAPMVTSSIAAQAARASQTNLAPGAQKTQTQLRATASSTQLKSAGKRSIQEDARTEGVFGEEESGGQQQEGDPSGGREPPSGFSRIA